MSERITGYLLLISGILIMIFAFFQIILVFTGKAQPIPIFSQKTIDSQSILPDTSSLLNSLQQGGGNLQLPKVQLIDPETIDSFLNMLFYYLIMQFLLSFGYKISTLGTQMLRPIQVHLKNRVLKDESLSEDSKK